MPASPAKWCWISPLDRSAAIGRLVQPFRREREDLDPARRHGHGMFELGRKRPIAGYRGPPVGEYFHMRPAEIDHRLDRKEHARFQRSSFAAAPVVQDIRFVVKEIAESVAAKIAHDGTS